MADTRTNVIYLTTKCNLDCSYCYERKNRMSDGFKHRESTVDDIHIFIDEVAEREIGVPSSVVIFGGEPLLRPDLIDELVEYGIVKKSGNISFNIITNGTLIDDRMALFLSKTYKKIRSSGSSLQIEISYDVSGQTERKYPNGKDSDDAVLSGIKKLIEHEVPYAISYTVTPSNYINILKDAVYSITYLKANKFIMRWALSILGEEKIDVDSIKNELSLKFAYLYTKYQVPICEEVCYLCNRCSKTKSGNNYYIPERGSNKFPSWVEKEFNHFIL